MEADLQLPYVHPPHGGDLKKIASRYQLDVAEISDFSININSLGMPAAAALAARESIAACGVYPDIRYEALRDALSRHYSLAPEHILPLAGAAEGIFLTASALRQHPAVILTPAFNEYEAAASGFGSVIGKVPLREQEDGFALPTEFAPRDAAGSPLAAPVVYLGNPNNPTGHLTNRSQLLTLARKLAQGGGVLVVDESFLDFLPERREYTLLQEAPRQPNLLVLVSLTKFFAMPGLRIGFAAGSQGLLRQLAAIQPSWSIAAPAAAAGVAALNDPAFIQATHAWVTEERAYLSQALAAFPGMRVFPAAANFLLLDVTATGQASVWWQEALLRQGFLVRLCEDFDGLAGRGLRVAVRLHQDNVALVAAFAAILGR